ncbi:transposase [Chloroflexota bacterium]
MRSGRGRQQRRSIRLPGYDYASPGAYFVTVCVCEGECLLGEVVDSEMRLSDCGRLAHDFWAQIPLHFPNVSIDSFVIMPNHLHATVVIEEGVVEGSDGRTEGKGVAGVKGEATSPLQKTWDNDRGRGAVAAPVGAEDTDEPPSDRVKGPSLGQIMAYFKHQTTKQINGMRDSVGIPFWQRNYWEHIVRSEESLNRIRRYIEGNPARWVDDQLHPGAPPNPFNQWPVDEPASEQHRSVER